jgi:hypothetical protein
MKSHVRIAVPTMLIAGLLLAAPTPGNARGGGGGGHAGFHGGGMGRSPGMMSHHHHGFGGHGHGGFVDGFFFFDPFFFPYYVPYPAYGPYGYGYPPPPEDWEGPPPEGEQGEAESGPPAEGPPAEQQSADAGSATYGLVQLRGVPDGAAVDLDGRFWLEAHELDGRWLALPHGSHTLTIRVEGREPVERRVDVVAGKTFVVRVGPFRERHA